MTLFANAIAVFSLVLFAATVTGAEASKTSVADNGLIADFYHVEGSPKKTGILFLGGAEGGKPDFHLPKMFADQGYPLLAPAYFKAKGLPDSLELIPLEYFDKAIDWMQRNEHVASKDLIVIGASKGAELALLLASLKPDIKGVIAIAPSSVVWQGIPNGFGGAKSSWSRKSEPMAFVPYDMSKGFNINDLLSLYKQSLTQKDAVDKAAIEVENINGPVLLLSGADDKLWPSTQMGDVIHDRLKTKAFKHQAEHVKYDDAGHTLNEFYMIGGTKEGNRKARIDSAKRMVDFLNMVNSKQSK